MSYIDCPRINSVTGDSQVTGIASVANSSQLVVSDGAPDTFRISIQRFPLSDNMDYNLISVPKFAISGGVPSATPLHTFYLIPENAIRGNCRFKTQLASQSTAGKEQIVCIHDSAHTLEVYTSETVANPQMSIGGVIAITSIY